MNRRELLVGSAALGFSALLGKGASAMESKWKKAILWDMLPGSLSVQERFDLAKRVGFDGVELPSIQDAAQIKEMVEASKKSGLKIHSIIYGGWGAPLSSGDPEVIKKGIKEVAAALQSAHDLGADDILLVPAIVNASTRYADAYKRSQEAIKTLIPTAEKLKVRILIEEVWNNFLLSPMEMARYVDDFKSPWVQSYFDVGNVVAFGWPEDWIRTLGKRIHRVHIKDYKGGPGLGGNGHFCALGEGSINWPEVCKALRDVGYEGWFTTELGGGDEAYLKDVSDRLSKALEL